MNWQDYISTSAGIRSGKPCIKGTRVTVSDVLEYLASGMDKQAIRATNSRVVALTGGLRVNSERGPLARPRQSAQLA
jgi:hypothetical protein